MFLDCYTELTRTSLGKVIFNSSKDVQIWCYFSFKYLVVFLMKPCWAGISNRDLLNYDFQLVNSKIFTSMSNVSLSLKEKEKQNSSSRSCIRV